MDRIEYRKAIMVSTTCVRSIDKYCGGHKSESTPIFVSHLEILSYLQNFYELKHAH